MISKIIIRQTKKAAFGAAGAQTEAMLASIRSPVAASNAAYY
jgi:hypothetical protein